MCAYFTNAHTHAHCILYNIIHVYTHARNLAHAALGAALAKGSKLKIESHELVPSGNWNEAIYMYIIMHILYYARMARVQEWLGARAPARPRGLARSRPARIISAKLQNCARIVRVLISTCKLSENARRYSLCLNWSYGWNYGMVAWCFSFCMCTSQYGGVAHRLLSHISPMERLFVLKTLSRTQRARKVKIFVGFSLKMLRCKARAVPALYG